MSKDLSSYFLSLEDVIAIHTDQINRYGGKKGIRDKGLLISAIAQPKAGFDNELLHKTLEAQAGAYLYHLVKNHPFIDGNKRVSVVSCLYFLSIHNYKLDPNLDKTNLKTQKIYLEEVVLNVVDNSWSKQDLIAFIKKHMIRNT